MHANDAARAHLPRADFIAHLLASCQGMPAPHPTIGYAAPIVRMPVGYRLTRSA